MSTYRQFRTSDNLETNGIWIDYGTAGRFRIARAGGANKRFTKKLQRLAKPFRKAIQAESMDDELADRLMMQAFCECVLIGWEGVTGPDGNPLPYSAEAAAKLFEDLPDLYLDLRQQAQNGALFREALLEADAGN